DHLTSDSAGMLVLGPEDYDASFPIVSNGEQRGYFFYSENDVDNDSDDYLQFTASIDVVKRNTEDHPFVGRASEIGRPAGAPAPGPGNVSPNDVNQPEFDDGDNSNSATQSRAAEISYFVRNGILYRRVLLLRDPLKSTPSLTYPDDPSMDRNGGGGDLIPNTYDSNADTVTPTDGDFWNDFDSSAICVWNDLNTDGVRDAAPTDDYKVHFNGIGALDPSDAATLGLQQYRFGFNSLTGRSVEFASGTFIGRFLHEETSHADFTWPGKFPLGTAGDPHPYERTDLTFDGRGVATQYSGGVRVGEDILMPNVDAFDVKIWDETLLAFVDLGGQVNGDFGHRNNRRLDYGPRTVSTGADGQPGVAGVDDDGDMTTDNNTELGWPGSDDVVNRTFDTWNRRASAQGGFRPPYRPLYENSIVDWAANTNYNAGDRIFPIQSFDVGADGQPGFANVDDDGDGIIDNGTELGTLSSDDVASLYDGIYYEAQNAGTSGATRPSIFAKNYNQQPTESSANPIVWESVDNRVGAKLLQITIRYRDIRSNLPRQLTIIHSFTDSN
ncbi:MAG: hypothetical protein KDA89_22110, partial [Planctomycetaceae bacterium]|nr:hypothetical protein [Planctomycetaceae bacterium]